MAIVCDARCFKSRTATGDAVQSAPMQYKFRSLRNSSWPSLTTMLAFARFVKHIVRMQFELRLCGDHVGSQILRQTVRFAVAVGRRGIDQSQPWGEAFLIDRLSGFRIQTVGHSATFTDPADRISVVVCRSRLS